MNAVELRGVRLGAQQLRAVFDVVVTKPPETQVAPFFQLRLCLVCES